jgi:hypothetical protein
MPWLATRLHLRSWLEAGLDAFASDVSEEQQRRVYPRFQRILRPALVSNYFRLPALLSVLLGSIVLGQCMLAAKIYWGGETIAPTSTPPASLYLISPRSFSRAELIPQGEEPCAGQLFFSFCSRL